MVFIAGSTISIVAHATICTGRSVIISNRLMSILWTIKHVTCWENNNNVSPSWASSDNVHKAPWTLYIYMTMHRTYSTHIACVLCVCVGSQVF